MLCLSKDLLGHFPSHSVLLSFCMYSDCGFTCIVFSFENAPIMPFVSLISILILSVHTH
eukprot:m.366528 g.366528  ORF g.366528 m.366528 type:complete len:59 (+) comp36410_c0_seq1:27-203(+)